MLGLTAAGTWGANILIWLVSGLCIAWVMGNNMTDRHVWKVCRSKELEEKHKVFITLCSPTMKTIGPQKEWLGTYRFNPPLNIYIYISYILYNISKTGCHAMVSGKSATWSQTPRKRHAVESCLAMV